MKLFSKIISGLFASFLLIHTPAYAAPSASPVQPYSKVNKPAAWQVAVINNTLNDYMTYASYLPSHIIWDTYLGPYGTPTDEIYYDGGVPNYCFTIVRIVDSRISYFGCLVSGTITLYPPVENGNNKSSAAPIVKVS